ncbi:MAG TPA: PAS domain S-box protein [Polyangiaceae bacterium]|nr:PAS domain S-box protein [Polyangiaceae bacterium]
MKPAPPSSGPGPTAPRHPALSDREPGLDPRARTEAALPRSEPYYRRMVEAAEEGMWMLDAQARTSFVNPRMALMLGYTVEEMQGRALYDFIDDGGRASAKSHLARRQQGISEKHELKFQRRDGSELWACLVTNSLHDTDGSYLGALAMVVDITERRREVAALRATEARFHSLFEHSPHCLWEEDLSGVKRWFDELRASGVKDFQAHFAQHPDDVTVCLSKVKVLDVNQAALQHYQAATKTELIEGLERILAPESFAVLTDELVALANGHTLFESEAVDQSFGGQKNHVLLKVLVAPGAEATLSRVYVSLVDITARKQLEEQLRQSQKMDAIGQLAGGIAHDFNNLLTAIQGDIASLRVPDVSRSQSAEALEHLALATERAAGLTRQLLAFSRRQVLQPRQLDINERVVVRRDSRHVRHPGAVWLCFGEVAGQQVGRDGPAVLRVSGPLETAFSATFEPIFAHQPLDALSSNADASRLQLLVHARAAINLPASLVHRCDGDRKLRVGLHASRLWSLLPSVEAAAGDAQHAAHRVHGEGHLLGDESELHSLSFAKKVAAAFKMSRSWASRLFSRRRRVSSSRSAVVSASGGPLPASTSARLTHSRSEFSVRSRSLETCVMVRSPTRAEHSVREPGYPAQSRDFDRACGGRSQALA